MKNAFLVGLLGATLLSPVLAGDAKQPGDGVRWTEFKPQKEVKDLAGKFLIDIESHLPKEYGKDYRHNDPVIHAHETTHAINAHIRNMHVERWPNVHALYVGSDRAVLLSHPKIRLSNVAEIVPKGLRLVRYETYLVKQHKDWEADPLYVFDEWIAYTNGLEAGVELARDKKYKPEKNDSAHAVIELSVYAVCVAMAAAKLDPKYDAKDLHAFLAWNLTRSKRLYREAIKLDALDWDKDDFRKSLKTSADAKAVRQFLTTAYGERWTANFLE